MPKVQSGKRREWAIRDFPSLDVNVPNQFCKRDQAFDYFANINETLFNDRPADERPYVVVDILGKKIISLLDSGASCCVLGKNALNLLKELNLTIRDKYTAISTADGTKHFAEGYIDLPVLYKNQLKILPTLIVPSIRQELILGIDFWKIFGIVPACKITGLPLDFEQLFQLDELPVEHDLSASQKERLNKIISILNFNKNNYNPTPILTHNIKTFSSTPCVSKPYQYSPAIEAKVHKEIDRIGCYRCY